MVPKCCFVNLSENLILPIVLSKELSGIIVVQWLDVDRSYVFVRPQGDVGLAEVYNNYDFEVICVLQQVREHFLEVNTVVANDVSSF